MEVPGIIILYVFAYWNGAACKKCRKQAKMSENLDETLAKIHIELTKSRADFTGRLIFKISLFMDGH